MNPVGPTYTLWQEKEPEGPLLIYDSLFDLVQLLKKGELEKGFINVKKIVRQKLIDQLHSINFSEGEIRVVFSHPKYEEIVTRLVTPQPCQQETVFGCWKDPKDLTEPLRDFEILCFLIESRREFILVPSHRVGISDQGIGLNLPEFGSEIHTRKTNRYPCQNIQAQLIQNGILFSGRLSVFSIHSFQVEIFFEEGISLKWINKETPGQIIFKDGTEIVYSGKCRIIKQRGNLQCKTLILQPISEPINRFKKREFRAPRQTLHPSPGIRCLHPLTKKMIRLPVGDLSTSGFSVEEEKEDSILLPGMIIPDVQLDLAYTQTSSCKAQVVYQNTTDETTVKSGFTVLNISTEAYLNLSNLINKSINNHLDICGTIELDALWEFFFKSGFIYPKKYHYIQQNKNQFKDLYRKIYNSPVEIERHITYQERGEILGHLSMLHIYETTWMLHHYVTSPKSRYKRIAMTLLENIERYIMDSHYFESSQLDNLICYFRPDNKFPNLVFGGAARVLKDPQICSLDRFVFIPYPMLLDRIEGELPLLWELTPAEPEDLMELAHFYNHTSGGQMIQALDLLPECLEKGSLSQTYHRLGFKRERRLLSIRKRGKVKAIISLLQTEEGLNLSELTNCLSVFVLESDDFPFDIFLRSLSQMSRYDERRMIPILLYPFEYAERYALAYERIYDLWVFVIENSDAYFKYMNKLFARLLT